MYNETLRDLLVSDVASPKKLDLQHDSHGGVRVANLSVYDLSTAAHGLSLIEAGCRARSVGAWFSFRMRWAGGRSVSLSLSLANPLSCTCAHLFSGATNMNAHSSRSHLIISISVRSRNKFSGASKSSKMCVRCRFCCAFRLFLMSHTQVHCRSCGLRRHIQKWSRRGQKSGGA
jgi:hypothetical protein